MSIPGTTPATPSKTPTANGTKKDRAAPQRRERSAVEAATSRVMNLIGRLPESDQRKVMAAVAALVAKGD